MFVGTKRTEGGRLTEAERLNSMGFMLLTKCSRKVVAFFFDAHLRVSSVRLKRTTQEWCALPELQYCVVLHHATQLHAKHKHSAVTISLFASAARV